MLRLPTPADYRTADEHDLAAMSFVRVPTNEADVERFGIDPNLAPPGEPHYLYDEMRAKPGADKRLAALFGRALGIDQGGDGATIGNAVITYAFTGNAQAGALSWDQWWVMSQTGDQAEDATCVVGVATPSSTTFSNAQVADFLSFQPFCVVNLNLVNASAASIISTFQLKPIRVTPFGTSALSTIYNLQYQTTVDFQTTRGQIPFSERVDGYTYIRMKAQMQAVAASMNGSFLLGLRPDRRSQVPKLPAQVLNSSGAGR